MVWSHAAAGAIIHTNGAAHTREFFVQLPQAEQGGRAVLMKVKHGAVVKSLLSSGFNTFFWVLARTSLHMLYPMYLLFVASECCR